MEVRLSLDANEWKSRMELSRRFAEDTREIAETKSRMDRIWYRNRILELDLILNTYVLYA